MAIISYADENFYDWQDLLSLIRTAFSFMEQRIDPPSSMHALNEENLREKARKETLILAHEGGQLVGCVFARNLPQKLYIGKLAISADFQGRGIGQQLVTQCAAFAQQKGLKTLEIQTRIELVENHRFFEKLGFIKTSEGSHEGYDSPTEITMQCASVI